MGDSVALLLSRVFRNEDFFNEIGNDENETKLTEAAMTGSADSRCVICRTCNL